MGNVGKIVAYIAGGLGLYWAGNKVFTLAQLAKRLIIEPNVKIAGAQLFSLNPTVTIQANPVLKNPTQGTIKVNHPMVMVYMSEKDYKDKKPVASSNPTPKDYTIPKSNLIQFDAIQVPVPLRDVGGSLFSSLQSGGAIKVWVEVYTLIQNTVPISELKIITIREAKNAS